jgi:hypothetical protein
LDIAYAGTSLVLTWCGNGRGAHVDTSADLFGSAGQAARKPLRHVAARPRVQFPRAQLWEASGSDRDVPLDRGVELAKSNPANRPSRVVVFGSPGPSLLSNRTESADRRTSRRHPLRRRSARRFPSKKNCICEVHHTLSGDGGAMNVAVCGGVTRTAERGYHVQSHLPRQASVQPTGESRHRNGCIRARRARWRRHGLVVHAVLTAMIPRSTSTAANSNRKVPPLDGAFFSRARAATRGALFVPQTSTAQTGALRSRLGLLQGRLSAVAERNRSTVR